MDEKIERRIATKLVLRVYRVVWSNASRDRPLNLIDVCELLPTFKWTTVLLSLSALRELGLLKGCISKKDKWGLMRATRTMDLVCTSTGHVLGHQKVPNHDLTKAYFDARDAYRDGLLNPSDWDEDEEVS